MYVCIYIYIYSYTYMIGGLRAIARRRGAGGAADRGRRPGAAGLGARKHMMNMFTTYTHS